MGIKLRCEKMGGIQLDYANAEEITVSTSAGTNKTYTPSKNGIIIVRCNVSGGFGTVSVKQGNNYWYQSNEFQYNASWQSHWRVVNANEQVTIIVGGQSLTQLMCAFIPFK